jgi:hypothetical protein
MDAKVNPDGTVSVTVTALVVAPPVEALLTVTV